MSHFDYGNLTSSGQMITQTGATNKGLFSIIVFILSTDNNSNIKRSMSSFLLWFVLLWNLKNCLCHIYYYILLSYVSLKSHVNGIVLFVAQNIFSYIYILPFFYYTGYCETGMFRRFYSYTYSWLKYVPPVLH